MDQPIHLVFVNGLATTTAPQSEKEKNEVHRGTSPPDRPGDFFAPLFPHAVIDYFSFLDDNDPASVVEWHLDQRGRALLEQLCKRRQNAAKASLCPHYRTWCFVVIPRLFGGDPLPIVFLAHGLGGFVVKQALISAIEEPRYVRIASHVSAALFFGVPHKTADGLTWQHLYLRLLCALPRTPRHTALGLPAAARLVEELEDASESFRTLPCRIDIVNYHEGGDHPLIDARCATIGSRWPDIVCEGRHDQLWHFTGEKTKVDVVSQILLKSNARDPLLREFLRAISVHDSQTHRLRPTLSAAAAAADTDYQLGHGTALIWKSDPTARILRVTGSSGSGITTFASHVLGDLLEHQHYGAQKGSGSSTTSTSTILSFAFSRTNPRARTAFSLYLSLCRQLVSFQPQLFRHVSSAASFWTRRSTCLTAECLWILLRTMMMNVAEDRTPVYCVICAVDQCVTFPGEMKVMQRLEELADAGDGRFKLLYTQSTTTTTPDDEQNTIPAGSDSGENQEHQQQQQKRLYIVLDSASQEMGVWKEWHIRSRIRDLVPQNASWDGLADSAVAQARNQPSGSPFLLTKMNMLLLEWTTKGWTRKHLKEKLLQPPSSLQDCYAEAIRTIKSECHDWVLLALQWIGFAVRPLRPSELAVAVALSEISKPAPAIPDDGGGGEGIDLLSDVRDMIRTDILGDLRDCMVPLIQVENNRVSFIHASFGDFIRNSPALKSSSRFSESEDVTENQSDHDCHILARCLEYLQQVKGLALDATSTPIIDRRSSSSDTSPPFPPTGYEYGFMTYATLHWPEHFLKTKSTEAARELVLRFLQDREQVSSWASLYQQSNTSLGVRSVSVDSPIRIVCRFGLSDLVDEAIAIAKGLAEGPEEELQVEKMAALDLAAEHGHYDIVRTLLEMEIRSRDSLGLAAAGGSVDIVERILAIDPESIDKRSWNRCAPIHHATSAGHKHVVSLLLNKNADVDVQTTEAEENEAMTIPTMTRPDPGSDSGSDSDSNSDLSYSETDSETNSEQGTLAYLLPASVWSETSLQLAARTGQLDIVELLLSKNANLHAESSVSYDALKYAAVGGFVAVVSLLLDRGAVGDKPSATDGNTALHLAAAHGHASVVQLLLRRATDKDRAVHMLNKGGLTPVDFAAREGHLDVLDSIFDVMDGKNAESTSAASTDKEDKQSRRDVPVAASRSKAGSSSRGLDPKPILRRRPTGEAPSRRSKRRMSTAGKTPWIPTNEDNRKSALEWAVERGHCHVVQALLARSDNMAPQKATQDKYGNTALHAAAKAGHANTIDILLNDPRCARLFPVSGLESRNDMTPLHLAAKAGHADVVGILLHHEAPLDKLDKKGHTALHHAARDGHLRCVDQLLSKKSDAKIGSRSGKTALHLAAGAGQMAVIRRVITQDIGTLWIQDDESAVALDYVVRRGVLEEVKEFVQMLEDVGGEDYEQKGTPLHTAAGQGHTDILEFLLDRGWDCRASRDSDGCTPLHEAVSAHSLEGVEKLLERMAQCDMNAVDNEGDSPLHQARDLDIVHALIRAGAANDRKNNEGETPSYLAAWRGRKDILEALLDSTPNPDIATTDQREWSLLHAAYDNKHIVKMLLDRNINCNVQDVDGRTPLSLALDRGHYPTAQVLLDAGADPNLSGGFSSSPLYCLLLSYTANRLDMVKKLVEKGADLLRGSEDGETALHLAVREGAEDVVNYMIDTLNSKDARDKVRDVYGAALCECVCVSRRFDPDTAKRLLDQNLDVNKIETSLDMNALQAACSRGTLDAVKWLLDQNADVDAKGGRYGTALCAAIESRQQTREKVLALLERKTKPDVNLSCEDQPTPLQLAVSNGNAELVGLLLQHGAEPNLTRPRRDTPLNEAISRPGIPEETIELLLKRGANVHQRGVAGRLPMHLAAIGNRPEVMRLLFSAEAEACAKDENGVSPLMYGLLNRNASIVRELLSRDAYDLADTDSKRQTPVIVATFLGDKTNLEELLSHGFDKPHILDAKDVHGKTALAHAARMDLLDVVELLIEKGADPGIVDCRGYGPLYWAVRAASQETTEAVIRALEMRESSSKSSCQDTARQWSVAVHAAVASGKRQALERLLGRCDVDVDAVTSDGWNPLYTARRYESYRMEIILATKSMQYYQDVSSALQIPSRWHPDDKHPGILIDPKNKTAFDTDGTDRYSTPSLSAASLEETQFGVVRADFPMLPLEGEVYYFEVTIHSVGDKGYVVIGFCDDQAPLHRMLGWEPGSWGFHSDDGKLYEDGRMTWKGIEYDVPYVENAKIPDKANAKITIGCGVNFAKNTAFYTKNGDVIGRAFTDIRGKLYPAVSINVCQKGWRVSTTLPLADRRSSVDERFVFKGDYTGPETLRPPAIPSKGSAGSGNDDSSSQGD